MKKVQKTVVFIIGSILLFAPSCALAAFDTNLSLGSRGATVVSLQQFLVSQGLLSNGLATGYFGNLTRQAVKNFQLNQGITPTSGFFGPITRAKANTVADSITATARNEVIPIPASTTTRFLVAPASGSAPLTVVFTTVEGTPDDGTMIPTLIDFGDGSPTRALVCPRSHLVTTVVPDPTGDRHEVTCSPALQVTHTYSRAGTFTAKVMQSGLSDKIILEDAIVTVR